MASIRRLNRFHSECTRQGVRVYFTHGVIPETRWRLWHSEFATAESLVARHLTIPRLESLEDVVVPDSWFYDTEYHLTREGVAARSHALASRLAARLAADGAIAGEATAQPAPR